MQALADLAVQDDKFRAPTPEEGSCEVDKLKSSLDMSIFTRIPLVWRKAGAGKARPLNRRLPRFLLPFLPAT